MGTCISEWEERRRQAIADAIVKFCPPLDCRIHFYEPLPEWMLQDDPGPAIEVTQKETVYFEELNDDYIAGFGRTVNAIVIMGRDDAKKVWGLSGGQVWAIMEFKTTSSRWIEKRGTRELIAPNATNIGCA